MDKDTAAGEWEGKRPDDGIDDGDRSGVMCDVA